MPLAGELVRADDGFTEWETFTPTFANFTVGNGSRAGRWRRVGNNTIELIAQMTLGSTSAVTGALGLTLPGGLSGDGSAHSQAVLAMLWDNSLATGYAGVAKLQGGGGVELDRVYANSTQVNGTTPFTWATSDFLLVQGVVHVTT